MLVPYKYLCGFYLVIDMKHGLSKTRLYGIWRDMKKRCYCQSCKGYKNYGGRGITICSDWLHDFQTFYNWAMDNGYAENLSIDRINVNGNYEPSNCRWATKKEQANNKRNNHFLTLNGKTQTITQWANEIGVTDTTVHSRLKRNNITKEEIITKPVARTHQITYNGETKSLRQWSISTGISYSTLQSRLYKFNWDIERALTTR